MCDWKKEKLEKHFEEFKSRVMSPRFACRKCGRVARDEQWLCKPVSLSD